MRLDLVAPGVELVLLDLLGPFRQVGQVGLGEPPLGQKALTLFGGGGLVGLQKLLYRRCGRLWGQGNGSDRLIQNQLFDQGGQHAVGPQQGHQIAGFDGLTTDMQH